MLVGLAAILITTTVILLFHPHAKSWSSILNRQWRVKASALHQPTGDTSNPNMGASESSERHETPEKEGGQAPGSPPAAVTADDQSDKTPKAKPARRVVPAVPSFNLDASVDDGEKLDELPPPSFPAVNSAQRASGPANSLNVRREPPKLKPLSSGDAKDSQLMPPPGLPKPRQAPLGGAGGLRVPSSGPLPNRGPPGRSSSSSLAPPSYKVTNMRQKITLTPGHSPLDWAALQRSNKNLSGVDALVRVTPTKLKSMNGRKGNPAWSSYQGKVYNISPYLPYHPGGEGELRRAAGKDGEKLFLDVHPWVNWDNMLGECLVGIMVSEGGDDDAITSKLDEMD